MDEDFVDGPSQEDIVNAVLQDEAFRTAVGGRERAAQIAEAAVSAALSYIGLFAIAEAFQVEVAGYG